MGVPDVETRVAADVNSASALALSLYQRIAMVPPLNHLSTRVVDFVAATFPIELIMTMSGNSLHIASF